MEAENQRKDNLLKIIEIILYEKFLVQLALFFGYPNLKKASFFSSH
jgi:hypothetical protein